MKQLFFCLFVVAATFLSCTCACAQYISTYAGIGMSSGYAGDGGPATDAVLTSPSDIAIDPLGNLLIADFVNNVIRKVDTFGIITTVAGTGFGAGTAGAGGFSGDNGPATLAKLNGPFALALDAAGNLIFADGYNHVVRKVTPAGIISTIAGNPSSAGYFGDGGPASASKINNPVGIAIDKAGNIFIADDHNNVIRKIDNSGTISTVVGNNTVGFGGDGGPASSAQLNLPIGIAFDTAGNLFIADARNNAIRKVSTLGIISTVVGGNTPGYTGDNGPAAMAKVDSPQRISFDDSNHMYISDFYNNVVRKVNATTGIITTVAGNGYGAGSAGTIGDFGGDDSVATNARIRLPHGVAFDKYHRMYICDRGNSVIRRVGPPKIVDHTNTGDLTPLITNELEIFPNPSSSPTIAVMINTLVSEPAEITVLNTMGQIIKKIPTTSAQNVTLTINEPKGVYFIQATTAHGHWVKPVLLR